MKKTALLLSFFLLFRSVEANAQLSTNPWLQANDEEEVAKIYQKRQKRYKGSIASYTPEESTVVDRTSAYIEVEQEKQDDSLIGKITGAVSPKKETKLIANTSSNRKALAAARQAEAAAHQSQEENSSFGLPSLGISNSLSGLKKNLKLPNFNATGLIQKFERASGINLKSIGKSFK